MCLGEEKSRKKVVELRLVPGESPTWVDPKRIRRVVFGGKEKRL
jgi:hypothetical protein